MKVSNRALLTVIPLALIAAAFWLLVISPKRDQLTNLDAQANQLRSSIATQQQALSFARQARQQFPRDYQQLVLLGKAVPSDDDTPSLLVQLNGVANGAGVSFRALKLDSSSSTASAAVAAPSPTPPSTAPGAGSTSGSSSATPASSGSSGAGSGGSASSTNASSGAASASSGSAAGSSAPTTPASTTPASPSGSTTTASGASSGANTGAASTSQTTSATPAAPAAAATETAVATLPIGSTVGPAGLPILPYKLAFRGDFFHVANFVHGLDGLVKTQGTNVAVDGRLVTINGFSLSQDLKFGFPKLSANFSVTTYMTPADQGLTAGATPSGPASPSTQAQATPASTTGTVR